MCAAMLFVLLANATFIQAFRSHPLNADPRNQRTLIDRFDHPRGDIVTYDGTTVATSRRTGTGPYEYRREYPGGAPYAGLTGHFSLRSTTGVEQAENAVLSGDEPRIKVRSLVGEGSAGGADVQLTITSRAQTAAYEGLKASGHAGAAVAINPETGAIIALATYPSYDPNLYSGFDPDAVARTDRQLRADPGEPLVNRAVSRNYPPGATFKLVTTAAALTSGEYAPTSVLDAPARLRLPGTTTWLPDKGPCGNDRPTLPYAFQASCDTAFANIGLQLGQDVLRDQAEAFGFNATDLAIPLPVAPSVYPLGMDRAQTALSAIGTHGDRATPLMIAMLSAAVANNGVLMRPYLVEEVRLADGSIIDHTTPTPYRTAMPAVLADQLTTMMTTTATTTRNGTSAAARGIRAAIVSGTGAKDHALFTAFAPAYNPEVAVGVVLEHAPPVAAVPIVHALIEAALS